MMKFRDACFTAAIFLVFEQIIPTGFAQEAARPPEQAEPTQQNVVADDAAKLTAEQEITEFFQAYQKATGDASGAQQIEFYDVNRLVAEVVRQAGVDWPEGQLQAMAQAFKDPLQNQMTMIHGDWYRHHISRIDFLDEFVDAEVVLRHWNADGITNRQLMWLHRTDDGWKIYDLADLSIGVSYTSMGAVGLRQAAAGNLSEDEVVAIRTLTQLVRVMNEADLDTAGELIDQLKGRPVPDFMEWFRSFVDGVLAIQYESGAALEAFDKVEAFRPDVPMLDYMRAIAYNLMSRHDKAEFHARRYLQRFGADADALVEVARAQMGREQNDAAIQTLRLALEDTPNSLTAIELLAICLPSDRKAEFLADFRAVRSPSESFQYLADSFEILREKESLRLLVNEMVKTHPEEARLDYYQAVALAFEEKHSESMDLLREAIKKVPEEDDYRYYYEELLRSEAMFSGRLLELYETAEDQSESFETLVHHAIDAGEYEAVREVVRAHLDANPSDAAALVLAGDVEFYAEDYASADARYAEAWRCDPVETEIRDEILYSRAKCWMEQGKIVEGYETIEPQDEIFDEFAEILSWRGSVTQVAELLELHRNHGHPMTVAYWDAWIKMQKEEYESVAGIVEGPIADMRQATDTASYLIDLRLSAQRLWVRSLIRLQKLDRALEVAKSMQDEMAQAYYEALVRFHIGDRKSLQASLDRAEELLQYTEEDFKDDEDYPHDEANERVAAVPTWMDPFRSGVMLLSSEVGINAFTLSKAARDAWNVELSVSDRSEVAASDSPFVTMLTPDSAIVGFQRCRLFIKSETEPLYGDAELLADERVDQFGDEESLAASIRGHKAWISVDVYVWPSDADDRESGIASEVPAEAEQLVGSLLVALAGDRALVVLHRDDQEMRIVDDRVRESLAGPRPLSAFAVSVDADDTN